MIVFDAYHGTDNANADSIMSSGFEPSLGHNEWLGNGCYFFLEGLSHTPEQQAEDWAILSAWDNKLKANKYNQYCVLKATISVEDSHLLDLTQAEGLNIFYYIKDKCIDKLKEMTPKIRYIDGFLINFGRDELGLSFDVVKGNVYIKLSRQDRIDDIRSRIPNCTICSVSNALCIANISNIKTGQV